MVDCGGSDEELEVIDDGLRYWGLSDCPVSHVLICHAHAYRMGNAHIIREHGAKIVAGLGDAEAMGTGDDRVFDAGPFKLEAFKPSIVDSKVKDGDRIKAAGLESEVIAVPGHTPGSVFYKLNMDGKKILLTGYALKVGPECKSSILG